MKSILCGVLFFGCNIITVGITTEPEYAHDADGIGYTIVYCGYNHSVKASGYVVLLIGEQSQDRHYGFIAWDIKKHSPSRYRVRFSNDERFIELVVYKPFPCPQEHFRDVSEDYDNPIFGSLFSPCRAPTPYQSDDETPPLVSSFQ